MQPRCFNVQSKLKTLSCQADVVDSVPFPYNNILSIADVAFLCWCNNTVLLCQLQSVLTNVALHSEDCLRWFTPGGLGGVISRGAMMVSRLPLVWSESYKDCYSRFQSRTYPIHRDERNFPWFTCPYCAYYYSGNHK